MGPHCLFTQALRFFVQASIKRSGVLWKSRSRLHGVAPLLAEGWSATLSVTDKCGGPGGEGESSAQNVEAPFIIRLCGEEAESGRLDALAAPNGCFRRPPGIALSAVPFVGDDMERIVRVYGCCHGMPASAGISPFGARSSDRQFTSDAICPFAL